jgi:2'-5' RNA ligase superfamily
MKTSTSTRKTRLFFHNKSKRACSESGVHFTHSKRSHDLLNKPMQSVRHIGTTRTPFSRPYPCIHLMAWSNKPLSYAAALSGQNNTHPKNTLAATSSNPSDTSTQPTPTSPLARSQSDLILLSNRPSGSYTPSEYKRHPDHLPHTSSPYDEEAYVLSLKTDRGHHAALTALRDKYFPRLLNKLSAHICLFRALPGSKRDEIDHDIEELCQRQVFFPIRTAPPFRLKHGVGIGISAGRHQGEMIFEQLRSKWEEFLSRQDNWPFKMHYTIVNKVDDASVINKCLEEVKGTFQESEGIVEGLNLWRYEKGYWKYEKSWEFQDGEV